MTPNEKLLRAKLHACQELLRAWARGETQGRLLRAKTLAVLNESLWNGDPATEKERLKFYADLTAP
jgi:hypothetical protein